MIINIRGTSGSGKSHLVRAIMEQCTERKSIFEPKRKRPLFYTMRQPTGRTLAVIGHYETPCGGCDTINNLDKIYAIVHQCDDNGWDVLYEGLLLSAEVRRAVELSQSAPLLIVGLTEVPVTECIDSVNRRRWAKNPDKPGVNPKNTMAKWKQTRRAMERFREEGVDGHSVKRGEAQELVQRALGWT